MAFHFRELTTEEMEAVSGGETIIITGPRRTYYGSGGWTGGGDDGGSSSDPRDYEDPPLAPDCYNSQPIDLLGENPPDNAPYIVPEGVTAEKLINAINHIVGIHDNNLGNMGAVYAELWNMYMDSSHPFYVDFKDWGEASGPPNTIDGGDVTYYSNAAGGYITADAFEPFGNYFYGFICTMAGLSADETQMVANGMQAGGWIDDPQDAVHVNKGIADAQKYLATPDAQKIAAFAVSSDCSSSG